MSAIANKIDFAVLVTVKKANPNGDPLNGNRPREDFNGYGEISDVCIKRKIRNRLQDMGERIFVQSSDRCNDGEQSLHDRLKNNKNVGKFVDDRQKLFELSCKEWIDVRSFGQVFAFSGSKKSSKKSNEESDVASVGVRGPVSVRTGESVNPIDIAMMQITKSVNGETGDKKSSDTMGSKNRVEFGLYKIFGSINPQLAEKTGFSDDDAEKIKIALTTLFENDASSARPDGSIEVKNVFWWKHNCKAGQYSSAKVHGSLKIKLKENVEQPKCYEDYDICREELEGLACEELAEICR